MFLTLADLAKQFAKSELSLRRVFKKLVLSGQLQEGVDFHKENLRDAKHFKFKINLERFKEEAIKIGVAAPLSDIAADKKIVKSANESAIADIKAATGSDSDDSFVLFLKEQINSWKQNAFSWEDQAKTKDTQIANLSETNLRLNQALFLLTTGKKEDKPVSSDNQNDNSKSD